MAFKYARDIIPRYTIGVRECAYASDDYIVGIDLSVAYENNL